MADPISYRVTVKRPFVLNDVVFGPPAVMGPQQGYPQYSVPPDVYNSTLPSGELFSDMCLTADPEYPPS